LKIKTVCKIGGNDFLFLSQLLLQLLLMTSFSHIGHIVKKTETNIAHYTRFCSHFGRHPLHSWSTLPFTKWDLTIISIIFHGDNNSAKSGVECWHKQAWSKELIWPCAWRS